MIKRALVFVVALACLSACGYRGALVLPEQSPQETGESKGADNKPSGEQ